MANDLTSNPIKVDTAAATILTTRLLWVTAIRWVPSDDVATGDELIVQNRHGVVFFHDNVGDTGTAANTIRAAHATFPSKVPLDGLIVPTIDDGTLYIYYSETKRN